MNRKYKYSYELKKIKKKKKERAQPVSALSWLDISSSAHADPFNFLLETQFQVGETLAHPYAHTSLKKHLPNHNRC